MEKPEIGGYKSVRMEMNPGTYYWCTCGKSSNQPFVMVPIKVQPLVRKQWRLPRQKLSLGVPANYRQINLLRWST